MRRSFYLTPMLLPLLREMPAGSLGVDLTCRAVQAVTVGKRSPAALRRLSAVMHCRAWRAGGACGCSHRHCVDRHVVAGRGQRQRGAGSAAGRQPAVIACLPLTSRALPLRRLPALGTPRLLPLSPFFASIGGPWPNGRVGTPWLLPCSSPDCPKTTPRKLPVYIVSVTRSWGTEKPTAPGLSASPQAWRTSCMPSSACLPRPATA